MLDGRRVDRPALPGSRPGPPYPPRALQRVQQGPVRGVLPSLPRPEPPARPLQRPPPRTSTRPNATLDLANRVAALSQYGVIALQQRITNESSRVRLTERALRDATWPQWFENQLATEWNADVFARDDLEGQALFDQLGVEAVKFDQMLDTVIVATDPRSNYALRSTLRLELRDPEKQGRVNVAVGKCRKLRRYERATGRQQARQQAERGLAAAAPPEEPAPDLAPPPSATDTPPSSPLTGASAGE